MGDIQLIVHQTSEVEGQDRATTALPEDRRWYYPRGVCHPL